MSQIGDKQPSLKIDLLTDFANRANEEIGKFKMPDFFLSPEKMMAGGWVLDSLVWDSIRYGNAELNKVPNDKRGVYAFVVNQPSALLPPHGYVLYIGIAGRDSERPLRERYRDYLNQRKVLKRSAIAYMIANWREVLRFFFAPVADDFSSQDLKQLEIQLNTALLPPYSKADVEAEVRKMRRAF